MSIRRAYAYVYVCVFVCMHMCINFSPAAKNDIEEMRVYLCFLISVVRRTIGWPKNGCTRGLLTHRILESFWRGLIMEPLHVE